MTTTSMTFDKYVNHLIALREQVNQEEPGLASRIPVATLAPTGGDQPFTTDPSNPGMGLIQSALWHRQGEGIAEERQHAGQNVKSWPDCILIL